ncbi:MAG: VOC family protein [Pseudomonadota bacterium]
MSLFVLMALSSVAAAEPPTGAAVNGFGGFFFRSEDPKALVEWYYENLGVDRTPTSYDVEPWIQDEGPTVFGPFPADSTYFSEDKAFMLNFRTADLDALVAHLRENGNKVKVDDKVYPNGRFARVHDPEGNPIQLWEPANNAQ